MKALYLLLFLFVTASLPLRSQVSHGGSPLFLLPDNADGLRSAKDDSSLFVEMPSFDVDSVLAEDQLNEGNMRGAFRFAHKFFYSIEKGKSGHSFVLADGTKVWQVGIRSKGAYSINLLFSEFEIPEGGQLFLYSADRSHIIGSFTHENNPEEGLFPTSPVAGEEIIVEYSEPAWAAFEAKLKITEVNHDYRDILRVEPANANASAHRCMPDILCSEGKDLQVNRSAVLLIINGSIVCSGSMINNTANDETPYLLTAMHCFNTTAAVHKDLQEYVNAAGTVITFFNYNRPVCGTTMRGVEEMSVAGTYARCIIEPLDVALLELKETPPDHYQVYYAGWNRDPQVNTKTSYVFNIHHPNGDLSKYGKTTGQITPASYTGIPLFAANSSWNVPGWATGSTAGGSSGSPLFDDKNRIIGALSGGESYCAGTAPNGASDLFSRFYLAWKYREDVDSLRLDRWLDSLNTEAMDCSGHESGEVGLKRLANADYNNGDMPVVDTVSESSDYLFGVNLRNVTEFAEAFEVESSCYVYGAYILTPPLSGFTSVTAHIYNSEDEKPGEKIASTVFYPRFNNYSGGSFNEGKKSFSRGAESFVAWAEQPMVDTQFFIGYELSAIDSTFVVYNTQFANSNRNTAWINDPLNGWTPANQYAPKPVSTALGVQALITHTRDTVTEETKREKQLHYDRNTHTISVSLSCGDSGIIRLYTIDGRLINEFSLRKDPPFTVDEILKNKPGIISLLTDECNETLKVVF